MFSHSTARHIPPCCAPGIWACVGWGHRYGHVCADWSVKLGLVTSFIYKMQYTIILHLWGQQFDLRDQVRPFQHHIASQNCKSKCEHPLSLQYCGRWRAPIFNWSWWVAPITAILVWCYLNVAVVKRAEVDTQLQFLAENNLSRGLNRVKLSPMTRFLWGQKPLTRLEGGRVQHWLKVKKRLSRNHNLGLLWKSKASNS